MILGEDVCDSKPYADVAASAFIALDGALEMDPFCGCAHIVRAQICIALGDFDGARKARQKAHNAAPPFYFVDSSTGDRRFRGWYSWWNGDGNGVGFRVNQKPIWQKIIPADSYEEDGVTVRCCDLQSDSSGWYFTVENAHETYTTLVRKSEADVIWEADLARSAAAPHNVGIWKKLPDYTNVDDYIRDAKSHTFVPFDLQVNLAPLCLILQKPAELRMQFFLAPYSERHLEAPAWQALDSGSHIFMERDGNWAIAIVDPHSKVERWLRSRDSSSLSEVQPPYLCFDWVEDVRDKTSLTHPYIGGLRVSELRKRDYKKVHVEFKHDKYAKFPMCTAVEHQNSPQRPKRVYDCCFAAHTCFA